MTDQSITPCPLSFKGIPYSDIINRWFSLAGGEPVEGERNDKLHRLASHLRYITDNNEETLLQIMPRYGLPEKEMKGLIHSACSAKWYSVPKLMQEACRGVSHTPECANEGTNEDVCADVSGRMQYAPTMPPELPKRLPKLIRLLVSRTPEVYRPAVAHAVFPSLATHLHQVRFKYIDNVEHEATLMNVLMAGTGAGKDCISEPINRIMADIRRRDEVNLRREREWKEEVNSKGANKDKRQRPLYGRRNLLELLPDEFTLADAVRARRTAGMSEKGTSSMLRQWVFRRYVTIVTNNNYQKLKFKA